MESSSALDNVASRPWHLKLDITLFDENEKNPTAAIIDVWQFGEKRRTVLTSGTSTRIELTTKDKKYYKNVGDSVPDLMNEVLMGFMHPGPQTFDMDGASPELRKQNFADKKFECIMLSRSIRDMKQAPLGLFPTYCAAEGTSDLRIFYPAGVHVFLRKRLGNFLEHRVTTELSIMDGTIERATAKVVSLTTIPEDTADFAVTDDLSSAQVDVARVAGSVIAGAKTSGRNPKYPASARQARIAGSVVMRAIIGIDGRIHALRVMSAGDPDLAIAALAAVRTWQYRPYLLNGEPTAVDTTITVNFSLNGF